MADTLEHRIVSWPVNPDGGLGDMSVFAELPDEGPDGTCLDAEGAIWVASRKHAIRVREGGEVTDEITLDHEVTACALGGSDGRSLLLTGAATRHSDPQTLHASRTGVVYEVDVDVPGAGRPSLYA
jgi:sugar lactone lactonase YvrE